MLASGQLQLTDLTSATYGAAGKPAAFCLTFWHALYLGVADHGPRRCWLQGREDASWRSPTLFSRKWYCPFQNNT